MFKQIRRRLLELFKGVGTNLTIYTVHCDECDSKFYQVMEPENIFVICPVCSASYLAQRMNKPKWAGFEEKKTLNLIPMETN